jgi:hypothetical protein
MLITHAKSPSQCLRCSGCVCAAAEVDPSVSIPVAAGVVQRQVLHPHQETMEGKTKAQDGSLVPAAAENISYVSSWFLVFMLQLQVLLLHSTRVQL